MSTRRIAELAKVSPTAVSLALKNSPKVSDATRQRVIRIAKRLGYTPNAKAAELMAQLRLRRTPERQACLGVISFYDRPDPWTKALHFQRMYEGMQNRAHALGYRLEPLWMKEPGMTWRRFRSILDTRGIQGLVCFGSPNIDEVFPRELDHFAIVTQGVSIKTPLHRIVGNVFDPMWRVLRKLWQMGYRRPGLVVGDYEGPRNSHAYLCAYLGWSHIELKGSTGVPVLSVREGDEKPLLAWLHRYKPDVMIFAQNYTTLKPLAQLLRKHGIRVPADLGVVAITQVLEDTDFSGYHGNAVINGEWAVELVVGRIMNSDFGFPTNPRIEMVDMAWVDGKTLRAHR
jgi:LacI family transcriptional regulator